MITHLSELAGMEKKKARKTIAVAAAHDREVLQAVVQAYRQGIADAILTGEEEKIRELLREEDCDPGQFRIIPADTDQECARKTVEAVRRGSAQFLMKGFLGTADLMREVVNHDTGISGGGFLSHVMFFEQRNYPKLLCLTDGGMCTFPTLEQKVQILKNAAAVMKRLGYNRIQAACVCGAENVNPKITATTDADRLTKMKDQWEPINMNVYGPVGLDMAVSRESCAHKHYEAEGAGEADILLVPTYEVGNGIGKAMLYFGGAKNAGMIVGAQAPVILVSRSDTAESKLASIALAAITAEAPGGENETGTV